MSEMPGTPKERFTRKQVDENGNQVPYVDVGAVTGNAGGLASVFIDQGQSRIFGNGAKWQDDPFGRTARHREPPFTEEEAVRYRLEYIVAALTKERNEFHEFKNRVLEMARNHSASPMHCPAPPADAAERLEAGRARMLPLVEEERELEAKLSAMPDSAEARMRDLQRKLEDEKAKRMEEMREFAGQVYKVNTP